MRKLIFATHNQHKTEEVKQMLKGLYDVISLEEIGCFEDIEETESTLEGNAILKARYVFDKYQIDCFADDTGLEIEALDNAPGVYSARYAGEEKNSAANRAKVLKELEAKPDRKARFRTVIALILNGEIQTIEGIVAGEILQEEKGSSGFGYDSIFQAQGYDKSFAELSAQEKNKISHRGQAVSQLISILKEAIQ